MVVSFSFIFVSSRFNRLTGVVRSSLQNIQKAIKVNSMFAVSKNIKALACLLVTSEREGLEWKPNYLNETNSKRLM